MVKIKTKNSEKLRNRYRMRISNNHLIYSAVILILAVDSLTIQQNIGLIFCFALVEHLRAGLISK